MDSPAHLGTFGAGKEGGDPSNPAPTAGLTSPLPILLAKVEHSNGSDPCALSRMAAKCESQMRNVVNRVVKLVILKACKSLLQGRTRGV